MNENNKFKIECNGKECPANTILYDCKAVPVTVYSKTRLTVRNNYPGVFKYADWLPISDEIIPKLIKKLPTMPFKIIKAEKLGKILNLSNLFFVYSGVGPTFTFKDLEAVGVISRWVDLKINNQAVPVFASDGNFARAMFVVSKDIDDLVFICVTTEKARISKIWHINGYNKKCYLISLDGIDADYYDAISLSAKISKEYGFIHEGGVYNIARRDFIGTILLEFVFKIGKMPDHYFQAVGSGIGPIDIYQTNRRLIEDGRFGTELVTIHIAQNYPFIPIVDAWNKRKREISKKYQVKKTAIKLISQVKADVLTNRFPAYSIKNGLYDILKNTSGYAYSITNKEIEKARSLVSKTEKLKIGYASGVSVAALLQAVEYGTVDKTDIIIVHLTDGIYNGKKTIIPPHFRINDIDDNEIYRMFLKQIYNSVKVK